MIVLFVSFALSTGQLANTATGSTTTGSSSSIKSTSMSVSGKTYTEQLRVDDGGTVTVVKCVFKNIDVNNFGGAIYVKAQSSFSVKDTAFLNCKSKYGGAAAVVVAHTVDFQSCLFKECSVSQYSISQLEDFGLYYPVFGAIVGAYSTVDASGTASMTTCVFMDCKTTGALIAGVCGVSRSVVQTCKIANCQKMREGWYLGVGPGSVYSDICYYEESITSITNTIALMNTIYGTTGAQIILTSASSSQSGSCDKDVYAEVEKLDQDWSTILIGAAVIGVIVLVCVIFCCVKSRKPPVTMDNQLSVTSLTSGVPDGTAKYI